MNEQVQYFCYFSVQNTAQAIVHGVYILLSIVLVIVPFIRYWKGRGTHNIDVSFIYKLVFTWWFTFVAFNGFGIILYAVLDNSSDISPEISSQNSRITRVTFLLQWLNAITIQLTLLYVPYHWARQITQLFSNNITQSSSQVQLIQKVAYTGPQQYIYPFLKYYMRIRIAFCILPILLVALPNPKVPVQLMIIAVMLDGLLIAGTLILGLYSLKNTKQLKQQLDQKQSKSMFYKYLGLLLACTIRFGFNLVYVIAVVFNNQSFSPICPPVDDNVKAFGFKVCQVLFTHYVPIFIVLRIYYLDINKDEVSRSLIDSSNNLAYNEQ